MNLRRNKISKPERTTLLLKICKDLGITIVSVDQKTTLIPNSLKWREIPPTSVFSENIRKDEFPIIWTACRQLQKEDSSFECFCGNSNQEQVTPGSLISGVYILKNKEWEKIS